MDHEAKRYQSPSLKRRRFAALAWLLLSAQLFSQLHALEHLEADAHDEHAQEVCQLCILSTGFDHLCLDTNLVSAVRFKTPRPAHTRREGISLDFAAAYLGRAPPTPSATT